jgi:polyisoprenoid-binding protein YceI
MKSFRALVLAFFSASTLAAQAPRPVSAPAAKLREYSVDFGHCIVEFSIGFAFSRIKGRFTDAKGTILYDESQPLNSSVTMVIETKSLDTGWPHRDEHLRTSDFFDVEKYPTIVFQSDRLIPIGNAWTMQGRLTMHGVTKQIAFPVRFVQPPIRSPESKWMVMNTAGSLRLARKDFGILGGDTYNSWFDKARAATMADSVDVSLEIEGYFPDATSQRSPRIDVALDSIRVKGTQYLIDRFANAKQTRPAAEMPGWLNGGDMVVRGLIATNQIADAVKFSRAFTELFPTETRAAAVYALALSVSGNSKGAAQQYARMKEIFRPTVVDPKEKFPQVDETWYWLDLLARTTLEWGYASQGVALARTLAEIYPGSARAHTTFGLLLAATGDAKGAAVEYAKALQADPRETRALEWQRRLGG